MGVAVDNGLVRPSQLRAGQAVHQDEGRIDSVSGHIAELLRREDDWRDARGTLDRIFERCPGPEAKHYAWARRALGVGPKPVG